MSQPLHIHLPSLFHCQHIKIVSLTKSKQYDHVVSKISGKLNKSNSACNGTDIWWGCCCGWSQDVAAVWSQDVAAGWSHDVAAGWSQDVAAGWSQDVAAGWSQDVAAGWSQDVAAVWSQDVEVRNQRKILRSGRLWKAGTGRASTITDWSINMDCHKLDLNLSTSRLSGILSDWSILAPLSLITIHLDVQTQTQLPNAVILPRQPPTSAKDPLSNSNQMLCYCLLEPCHKGHWREPAFLWAATPRQPPDSTCPFRHIIRSQPRRPHLRIRNAGRTMPNDQQNQETGQADSRRDRNLRPNNTHAPTVDCRTQRHSPWQWTCCWQNAVPWRSRWGWRYDWTASSDRCDNSGCPGSPTGSCRRCLRLQHITPT